MAWQEWFPDFKVPRDLQRLVDAGLLRDSTLPWSAAPLFEAILSDGSLLTFHAGHASAEKRIGQVKRFEITVARPGQFSEVILETDNVGVAMEALRAVLRSEGGPRMGDVTGRWIPMWHLTGD